MLEILVCLPSIRRVSDFSWGDGILAPELLCTPEHPSSHPRGFPTIHLSKSTQHSTRLSFRSFEGGGIISTLPALSTRCREKNLNRPNAVGRFDATRGVNRAKSFVRARRGVSFPRNAFAVQAPRTQLTPYGMLDQSRQDYSIPPSHSQVLRDSKLYAGLARGFAPI